MDEPSCYLAMGACIQTVRRISKEPRFHLNWGLLNELPTLHDPTNHISQDSSYAESLTLLPEEFTAELTDSPVITPRHPPVASKTVGPRVQRAHQPRPRRRPGTTAPRRIGLVRLGSASPLVQTHACARVCVPVCVRVWIQGGARTRRRPSDSSGLDQSPRGGRPLAQAGITVSLRRLIPGAGRAARALSELGEPCFRVGEGSSLPG
jgi:hypothetical protein